MKEGIEEEGIILDENTRLMLQYFSDHSDHIGWPSQCGSPEPAIAKGLIEAVDHWNDSRTCSLQGYQPTEIGRRELADANRALGSRATRLVRKVKYFDPLPPVVYGWPIKQPLSAPVCMIDGSLVADERGFIGRLLGKERR